MAPLILMDHTVPDFDLLLAVFSLAPAVLMLLVALGAQLLTVAADRTLKPLWAGFRLLSALAAMAALASLALQLSGPSTGYARAGNALPGLLINLTGAWIATLVQLLGTVIGVFSARYLHGEANQARYVAGLAAVLAAVQLLVLADHWLILIGAWAMAGAALQRLLCFYADRPFALLAAHKKRVADRAADALLLGSAVLAWSTVGSGSLSELMRYVSSQGSSPALELSALGLVLAVVLRSALLPVHGWLTQVMEAPTPVSALLHAGVVNLGGFVLIRFAGLLEATTVAPWLLVLFGLGTAVLAGFVMLTRISIKVRLAWSTVAQMGFMVLECGLGLYQLALLHLLGHSLYKAHSFLAASGIVRQTRIQLLHGTPELRGLSLIAAPALAFACISLVHLTSSHPAWPWWWSAVLALAWAPMLWLPQRNSAAAPSAALRLLCGSGMVGLLSLAALVGHALPLGVGSMPKHDAGLVALAGMSLMYVGLATLQQRHGGWARWRRWSYAGFYVDELFTRLALKVWPTHWAATSPAHIHVRPAPAAATATP